MQQDLLLAEELALVAVNEDTGRHALGLRTNLNACLAGLLVAELVLNGHARPGDVEETLVLGGGSPGSPTLAAAGRVLVEKGPKIKGVLSHMDRGLTEDLGRGTWDAAISGLVEAGVLGAAEGSLRRRHDLVDRNRREQILSRLSKAVAGDTPLEPRTALLLAMTGPANLLEVVAPERATRRHARHRIDHALEGSPFEPVRKVVRRLIAEAEAAAAT